MNHRDADPSGRSQDPSHCGDGALEVVDVHERHLAYGAIEGPAVPPLIRAGHVSRPVGDTLGLGALGELGRFDQPGGQVDAEYLGASSGQLPRGPTRSAGDIQPALAVQPVADEAACRIGDEARRPAPRPPEVPLGDAVVSGRFPHHGRFHRHESDTRRSTT